MDKPLSGRRLLALLLAPALIILLLFLVSCGQSNPANPPLVSSTTTTAKQPVAEKPVSAVKFNIIQAQTVKLSLSGDGITNTISWDNYPDASAYNLYYANSPDMQNAIKITNATAPYLHKLADSESDYFYAVTAVIKGSEKRVSLPAASVYRDGKRYNFVDDSVLQRRRNALTTAPPLLLTSPSSNCPISFQTSFKPTVSNYGYYNVYYYVYFEGPSEILVYQVKFNGWGQTFEEIYLSQQISLSELSGGLYQITVVNYGFTPIAGSITLSDGASFGNHTIPAAYPPGQVNWANVGSVSIGNCATALTSIAVSPTNATVYLHTDDPASKMATFTASGNYSDGTTASLTATATWVANPADIATITAGVATPSKPGTAKITATAEGITSDPPATLEVMCREYPHLRQNVGSWKDLPYANYTNAGALTNYGVYEHSIGALGCHITSLAMAFNGMGFLVYPDGLDSWLKNPENMGYDRQNAPLNDAILSFGRGTITAISGWKYGTLAYLSQSIKDELSNCNIVIAYVHGNTWLPAKNRYAFPHHYILLVKEKDNSIKIYDPWWRNGDQTPQLANIQTHYTLMGYRTITTNN